MKAFSIFFEEFRVDGSDHEVKCGTDADKAGHGVHRVVVDERGGVDGALRHDLHQLGDSQGLGLDQSLCLRQICPKRLLKL